MPKGNLNKLNSFDDLDEHKQEIVIFMKDLEKNIKSTNTRLLKIRILLVCSAKIEERSQGVFHKKCH